MDKPAFPRPHSQHKTVEEQDGMSLLEYYAGQALVGIISNSSRAVSISRETEKTASICFDYAEAMIKEAEKR